MPSCEPLQPVTCIRRFGHKSGEISGDFLAKHPRWHATVSEKLIELR
jgi:hypothetical protein